MPHPPRDSLGLIVPHSDGLVSGAGGYERLSYANIHTCDLPLMKRVGQIIKTGTGTTLQDIMKNKTKKWHKACGHRSSHKRTFPLPVLDRDRL